MKIRRLANCTRSGDTASIVNTTELHHLNNAVTSVSVKFSDDKIASLEKLYVQHAVVGFVQSEPYATISEERVLQAGLVALLLLR